MELEEISVGAGFTEKRRYLKADVVAFAELTGDFNPIHCVDEAAQGFGFIRSVVHGSLVIAGFSKILGMDFPGPGTIYLGQEWQFKAPLYIDEDVTFKVTVESKRVDKPIITMKAIACKGEEIVVVEGKVVVKYQKK